MPGSRSWDTSRPSPLTPLRDLKRGKTPSPIAGEGAGGEGYCSMFAAPMPWASAPVAKS
jgi:hypothetical protein